MIKRIVYTAALLFLLNTAMLAQTVFFVSPGGKNTNPGTKEKPFASIDHAKLQARKVSGSVMIDPNSLIMFQKNQII